MKHRVGIITFHRGNQNYGSTLQAYALQRMLAGLGHEASIIDYYPVRQRVMAWTYAYRRKLMGSVRFRNAAQVAFLHNRGVMTSPRSRGDALQDFSALVTGSDEVWKVRPLRGFDPVYFLRDAPRNARTISYAASCVPSPDMLRYEGKIRQYVHAITHRSVRELRSALLVAKWTGVMPPIVLDPTLACPEFDIGLCQRTGTPQPPFLYLYSAIRFKKPICTAIADYASHHALQLHSFNAQDWLSREECTSEAVDVEEFVGCFRAATGVITDTFHGVCLAIRCRTPFVFVSRDNKQYKVSYLLDVLGLTDRVITDAEQMAAVLNHPISWESVEARLELQRAASLGFLRKALK